MDGVESPFQHAMARSDNRTRLGMNALLAWVAVCDGTVTSNKQGLLRKVAGAHDGDLVVALDACRELKPDDLIVACKAVQELPASRCLAFIRWAIALATADGGLADPANFLLRFFADLTQTDLEETYQQLTKQPLPIPGDAGSVRWWQNLESNSRRQSNSQGRSGEERASRAKKSGARMPKQEALAVLGLQQDASADEIAHAFRRLAHVHHPDRFSQSSDDAQRNASKQFARIREAFEALT